MNSIYYCKKCDGFTMEGRCSKCGGAVISAKPLRFRIEDKWQKYRLLAKAYEEKDKLIDGQIIEK